MLQLNLDNNTSMTVDLIDDPWVEQWAQHVVTLQLAETEHAAIGSSVNSSEQQFHADIDLLIAEANTLLPTVGLAVPDFLLSASELKQLSTVEYQQQMNDLHRWLVYCMFRKPFYVNNKNHIPENINHLFDTDFDGMLRVLFTLNQLVHQTETGYTSPGAASFPSTQYGKTYWDQGFEDDDNIGLFSEAPVTHLLTNNNYDVWLAKRILGKDFRECWLDADNPAYADIVNVGEKLHCCFEVDPLNDDTEFYESDAFKQWMQQHNRSIDPAAIGRIPLGNIIDKPIDIEEVMHTCRIESIELV